MRMGSAPSQSRPKRRATSCTTPLQRGRARRCLERLRRPNVVRLRAPPAPRGFFHQIGQLPGPRYLCPREHVFQPPALAFGIVSLPADVVASRTRLAFSCGADMTMRQASVASQPRGNERRGTLPPLGPAPRFNLLRHSLRQRELVAKESSTSGIQSATHLARPST